MISLKALFKQLKPTGRRIRAIMIVCRNYRLSTSLTLESHSRKVVKRSELAQFLRLEVAERRTRGPDDEKNLFESLCRHLS